MKYTIEKTEFVIEGSAPTETDDRNRIWIDGVEVLPDASQKIRNHSPDGFNWGYGGSGPAQAALAICLHILGHARLAEVLYQQFKRTFVASWQPAGESFWAKIDITDFLIENRNLIQREEELEKSLQAEKEYNSEE